jgi:hypothetical protein
MLLISCARHQVPPVVIQHAVWLCVRFTLSDRDVEDLLAERGLEVSCETVRRWLLKSGPAITRRLRQGRARPTGGVVRSATSGPERTRAGGSYTRRMQFRSHRAKCGTHRSHRRSGKQIALLLSTLREWLQQPQVEALDLVISMTEAYCASSSRLWYRNARARELTSAGSAQDHRND